MTMTRRVLRRRRVLVRRRRRGPRITLPRVLIVLAVLWYGMYEHHWFAPPDPTPSPCPPGHAPNPFWRKGTGGMMYGGMKPWVGWTEIDECGTTLHASIGSSGPVVLWYRAGSGWVAVPGTVPVPSVTNR